MVSATGQNESFWQLIKKGNKSSAIAAIGNAVLAAAKGFAFLFGGGGALFASAMHSLADAINQGFVFVGSVLAERKPTPRFPTGFGRVINIFCMVAVIVVSIMAYETILEGWHLIQHPAEAGGLGMAFWIGVAVMLLNIIIDGTILVKAMKEISHEARVEAGGFRLFPVAFANVGRAAPPTRLVFFEDLVAVSGAALTLIAVIVSSLTDIKILDGIASIIIGLLMVVVAFRVGYDNMVGLIGVAAPRDVEDRIVKIIMSDEAVKDINRLQITQEGRNYHIDGVLELKVGLTLAEADDIKHRVKLILISEPDITDVTLGIIEDNGKPDWKPNPPEQK